MGQDGRQNTGDGRDHGNLQSARCSRTRADALQLSLPHGGAVMPTLKSAWHWVFGKHEPKPPNPDRTVEAAWLPLWQAQYVTDELVAQGVPAVWNEDFNIHIGVYQREPMARIFVTEDRRAEAEEIVEDITGLEPRHRKL